MEEEKERLRGKSKDKIKTHAPIYGDRFRIIPCIFCRAFRRISILWYDFSHKDLTKFFKYFVGGLKYSLNILIYLLFID